MWQDTPPVSQDWYNADLYCDNLTLGDYGDWRLPTRAELVNIVDYSHHDPSIDPVFVNVVSDRYWTSSTYVLNSDRVWSIEFERGTSDSKDGGESLKVKCVRSEQE